MDINSRKRGLSYFSYFRVRFNPLQALLIVLAFLGRAIETRLKLDHKSSKSSVE